MKNRAAGLPPKRWRRSGEMRQVEDCGEGRLARWMNRAAGGAEAGRRATIWARVVCRIADRAARADALSLGDKLRSSYNSAAVRTEQERKGRPESRPVAASFERVMQPAPSPAAFRATRPCSAHYYLIFKRFIALSMRVIIASLLWLDCSTALTVGLARCGGDPPGASSGCRIDASRRFASQRRGNHPH